MIRLAINARILAREKVSKIPNKTMSKAGFLKKLAMGLDTFKKKIFQNPKK